MNLSKEKIKLVMARNELTVTELAERCKLSRQRINHIFNSKNVAPKTAGKIARALECDVTDIIES